MIVMQLNIDVGLQMMMASNCSHFTSFDLKVRQKTDLNGEEVDESNEFSSKRGKLVRMTQHQVENDVILKLYWLFGGY